MLKKIRAAYFLRKMRRILRQQAKHYRRKAGTLSPTQKEDFQRLLTGLQSAIMEKDVETAERLAHSLTAASRHAMPKNWWDQLRDLVTALAFALVVALFIRQMWFELYTIPSGSMRPTLKENDLLLVSKTDFGLNTVSRTSHFYFDPSLVHRGAIVIFSVENLDVPDPDTKYFLIFPGKKQYVKRLIGKPGDTLYFYGGQIYGIDAEGNDLPELRESPWSLPLEHIPFIRFDGKAETPHFPSQGIFSPVVFHQFNEPVAKLTWENGKIAGEMIEPMKNYSDIWGSKNFAMARLLNAAQVKELYPAESKTIAAAPLYLELTHHPSLAHATLQYDEYRRLRPTLGTSASLIPLDDDLILRILRHMTTCRFVVKDGVVFRYGSPPAANAAQPRMKDVPDGTYEIENGAAYRIYWGGITHRLPSDHPLLRDGSARVQLLFNQGIEWDAHYNIAFANPNFPSRYAYFRNQALYLMGERILEENDPTLIAYLKHERDRQSSSPSYEPFLDFGPPSSAGFIQKFGLKIPDGMYLVLGDNHAMSADSRQFGFVPQDNLRGGASFLLWPPGPRWGRLAQPSVDYFAWPNVSVWTLFLAISAISAIYFHRQTRKRLNF